MCWRGPGLLGYHTAGLLCSATTLRPLVLVSLRLPMPGGIGSRGRSYSPPLLPVPTHLIRRPAHTYMLCLKSRSAGPPPPPPPRPPPLAACRPRSAPLSAHCNSSCGICSHQKSASFFSDHGFQTFLARDQGRHGPVPRRPNVRD